jgi:hypothetical protein
MNLYELSRKTDQLLDTPSTATHFSSSFEKLLEFLAIAIELKGQPGWYLEVNKRLGSNLTEEEAERLEEPLSVLYGKMTGGAAPIPVAAAAKQNLAAATQKLASGKAAIGNLISDTKPGPNEPPYYEWWALKFFKGLADKVQEMGPFNYTATDAADSDIPIGNAFANVLTLIPVVRAAETAENAVPGDAPKVFKTIRGIVLPYRAAGMIAHTLLSISRYRGATSAYDVPFWRQIQSVISALLDLMMGDWKAAALSLAGIYSQHAAYAGIVGQLVLNILSMMDPDYQESIVGGITAVPKSILIGLLLHTFQTFATNEVRKKAIETLANFETNIETTLTESIEQSAFKTELVAAKQTGVSELNFGRINLLQKMIHRKAMVCDKEFRHIFERNNVKDNIILLILFKLMDIPLTEEEYTSMCPTDKWATGMFAQNKKEIQPCRTVVPPTEAPPVAAPAAPAPASVAAPAAPAPASAVATPEGTPAIAAPASVAATPEGTPVAVTPASVVAAPASVVAAPESAVAAPESAVAPTPAFVVATPANSIKGGLRRSRKKRSTSS